MGNMDLGGLPMLERMILSFDEIGKAVPVKKKTGQRLAIVNANPVRGEPGLTVKDQCEEPAPRRRSRLW
jgi:hypothetical protein